ncbi:MAG TPA: hemolysin family protein [Caldilineaceae bacterium]|nr:hemolysin family protein [Caldilineaceae bacterium]
MSDFALEFIIIFLLLIANGVFAMSELAVLSARKTRLEQKAESGDSGARAALELATAPDLFLSTVQVGITLIGTLAGAFGGATLAGKLADVLNRIPLLAKYSTSLSVFIVVLIITYLSLIIGELVPKRLALNDPEGIARAVAPTMRWLSRIAAPAVKLLTVSTNFVLRFFDLRPSDELPVTEEEVRIMMEQGTQVGVFEPIEGEIMDQVFRLSDRTVSALLTPRTDIVWLNLDATPDEISRKIVESGYARYPVAQDNLDNIVGLVSAQSLLAQSLAGQPLDLHSIIQPALFIPETTPALVVVERLKQTRSHIALVIDEYGGVEGLVTLSDILTAIVGDIPDADEIGEAEAVQRADGSWLVDGMFQIDDLRDLFSIEELPEVGEGYYQTVGGLVMAVLGRVPSTGDSFVWAGYRFEVMDMDGRRVDKMLISPVQAVEDPPSPTIGP